MTPTQHGVWLAVAAYAVWGVLPVYWKALRSVPATEILAHRIVWSFVFLGVLVGLRREWTPLRAAVTRRNLQRYTLAAVVLSVNWLTYIWAVNASRIVETSLGYFINPLVSVALAVVFLRERLRPVQWGAVALAGLGVGWQAWQHGAVPWVALALAFSFAVYGLLKKTAPLPALQGLTFETAILWLPALGFLAVAEGGGGAAFGHTGPLNTLLLAFTGVVTASPLLLFAAAARRIPLATLGLLQYLAPSIGLLIGVGMYGEPFGRDRAVGFGLIWAGLALFTIEGLWRRGSSR